MTPGWRAAAVGLLGLAACRGPASEPGPEAAGLADARAALDEQRRALVDSQQYPLRQGMTIDEEALRQTLLRMRAEHGPLVAVAYRASIDALPVGQPPGPPEFHEVAAFELPDEPAMREAEALNWLFDADVEQTARRLLSTYLTLVMHQQLELSPKDIGVWMAYLRAAEPTLRRCDETPERVTLCVDYGDDVFVLELSSRKPGWIARRFRWLQRRPQ
ncbi:MAG: hypothetical protein AB1Z98_30730 [Nannocystaceae bacterium]